MSVTDEYLDARAEYERAKDAVQQTVDILLGVQRALEHSPFRFQFSNTGVALPAEVSFSRQARSEDGNKWPTAEQINMQLSELHSAKDKMLTAWSALPEERKAGLNPPSRQARAA